VGGKEMKETKQTKSRNIGGSGDSHFTFCCSNRQKMLQLMEEFCGSEGPDFDCCTMMQKMCDTTPEKGDKK
jgi:hypothetical protein